MIVIILFAIIFILTILVCKNNLKNRTSELKTNLQKFNDELAEKFKNIPLDSQQNFLNLLDPQLKSNLHSILNHTFNYANNHWAIQQQIVVQQELFKELHNFIKNN
jgi:predicted PurR-regulated permease PerM